MFLSFIFYFLSPRIFWSDLLLMKGLSWSMAYSIVEEFENLIFRLLYCVMPSIDFNSLLGILSRYFIPQPFTTSLNSFALIGIKFVPILIIHAKLKKKICFCVILKNSKQKSSRIKSRGKMARTQKMFTIGKTWLICAA